MPDGNSDIASRASTRDVHIAAFERLSLAIEDTATPALADVLANLDFTPIPSLDPARVAQWRQSASDARVEFLTPSFGEDEGLRGLPSLGVAARVLPHLDYLLAEPIHVSVIYRGGVLVQVPRPERLAVHKLIVADRRLSGPEPSKSVKDLAQAELLIDVLATDRPDELAEAYQVALDAGPKWRERLAANLRRRPRLEKLLESLPGG